MSDETLPRLNRGCDKDIDQGVQSEKGQEKRRNGGPTEVRS